MRSLFTRTRTRTCDSAGILPTSITVVVPGVRRTVFRRARPAPPSSALERRIGVCRSSSPPQSAWAPHSLGTSASARLYRRGGLTVEASNSHSDYWVRNLVSLRAESRQGLAIFRPQGVHDRDADVTNTAGGGPFPRRRNHPRASRPDGARDSVRGPVPVGPPPGAGHPLNERTLC